MGEKKWPTVSGHETEGRKTKYHKHSHRNTKRRKNKCLSRKERQRQQDAALLDFFGLAFEQVGNTTFHRLCAKGAP